MTAWGALAAGTKKDLEDCYFCTKVIFPGGLNPRLEELIQAVNPYFEVVQVQHPADRLPAHDRRVAAPPPRSRDRRSARSGATKVFDDYDRYLATCVRAFDMHYSSLAQYELRRID